MTVGSELILQAIIAVLMVVATTILAPLWLKRVVAAPVSIESIVPVDVPKATNPEVPEASLQTPPSGSEG